MQRICVDEQNFSKIRTAGGIYVDKTKQIYDLFSWGTYFFIARPRRFGKSLLCSTLAELFAGNRELFKDTWIDSSDWKWEKHPVVYLDMTSAAGEDVTLAEVREALQNMLVENAERLGINLKIERPAAMLEKLLKATSEKHGVGVALIIDEYDKPILDTLNRRTANKQIYAALRSLYGPLKKSTSYLKFVFITGVFKFTKTSLFSNFNNLKDITFNPKAATLCGYTEQEIRLFFAEHLITLAKKAQVPLEEMMLTLRDQYNGYFFGIDTMTKELSGNIYNPYGLNYVFTDFQLNNKWFESGSPMALVEKLAGNQFKDLDPSKLTIRFGLLDRSCTPGDLNISSLQHGKSTNIINATDTAITNKHISSLSMLYYAGYVTMKAYDKNKVFLGFPNQEVASDFSELLVPYLLQKSVDTTNEIMDNLHDLFVEQRLDDLKELLNDALAPVSYHTLKKPSKKSKNSPPQENVYQFGFYYLFIGSRVKTNIEDTSISGRIDISVETASAIYLFEFKMNDPATSAIKQIRDKDYAHKFKYSGKKIYAVGVSICSKKRTIKELEWTLL